MTTDLPRGQALRRLLAPLPAAAFAVLVGLSCATPAHAAAADEEAEPQLTVVASTRGVVHSGASLMATVTIDNPGTEVLDGANTVLQLGTQPLADRTALHSWLAGTDPDLPLTSVGVGAAADVAPGQSDSVGITIPADNDALQGLGPGVYPLRAQYGEISAQTVVVVSDAPEPVALVMPITAPATASGLLSADQLAALTAPEGILTAQLDAASATSAILAVDPAIPAAIRVLGEDAPLSAVEWLDDLMLLSNDRFALQFGDADMAAQVQAGLPALLQPLSLEGYAAAPEPTPTPSPSPTESPAAVDDDTSALDLAALLEIGEATPSLYWPAPGQASTAVFDALAASDPEAVVLTPSDATTEGAAGKAVPGSAATAGGATALVYDDGASDALGAVVTAATEQERATATATATAELWFAGRDAGTAPVMVALDRGLTTAPFPGDPETVDVPPADLEARLSAAVDVIGLSSVIDPLHLDELMAAAPATITPVESAPDAERVAFAQSIPAGEEHVATIATALENPAVLTGIVRAEALQALGAGWAAQPAAWAEVAAGFAERTGKRGTAVGIQEPAPVNLLAANTDLPVWVRNDLPWPVTVTLRAKTSDPRLDIADTTQVIAQPRSSTAVQVPVEARVGSGNVDIELTLIGPGGEIIGPVQTVEVNVRAEWETIGVVILGALIVGLIGTGIVRTVLRRRKPAASGDESATERGLDTPEAADSGGSGSPDAPTEGDTHG